MGRRNKHEQLISSSTAVDESVPLPGAPAESSEVRSDGEEGGEGSTVDGAPTAEGIPAAQPEGETESADDTFRLAPPPPREGSVSAIDSISESGPGDQSTPSGQRKKPGRKKGVIYGKPAGSPPAMLPAVPAAPIAEPGMDDIEDAKLALSVIFFDPCAAFLEFETPSEERQFRLAKLGAKLWIKYSDGKLSDEYKFAGLLLLWFAGQFIMRVKTKNDERNNANSGAQADGQNPLDVAGLGGMDTRSIS